MLEYKSEIVKNASAAWFSDKASVEDLENLDKLLNERAKEGWELATYSYMSTSV